MDRTQLGLPQAWAILHVLLQLVPRDGTGLLGGIPPGERGVTRLGLSTLHLGSGGLEFLGKWARWQAAPCLVSGRLQA